MILLERTSVMNLENALRGARNPMNSWAKSDSYYDDEGNYIIGEADLKLGHNLCYSGSDHRKFIRQIFVSVDITAPLYWWKEFDTYKVGTVANSCSTMHKIASKEFDLSDFSIDHISYIPVEVSNGYESYKDDALDHFHETVRLLNAYRKLYLDTKDKTYWWQLIQLLPSSYNQKRTITMNYENAITIIKQRTGHKLDEWAELIDKLKTLPFIERIIEDGN